VNCGKLKRLYIVILDFSAFLEFFQKLPGGWWITARRYMPLYVFWVPGRGTAWRHTPSRQATHNVLLNLGSVGWSAWRYRLNRQTIRSKLICFCVLWGLGGFCSEESLVLTIVERLDVEMGCKTWHLWVKWNGTVRI